jgi:Protein of unknown function (DUF3618)
VGQGPEELRAEIERSREDLGRDADALADRVSPRRVVQRRVDRTRSRAGRLRDRVMGVAGSAQDSVVAAAHSATSTVSGSGASGSGSHAGTGSTLADVPGQAMSRASETGGQAVDKVRTQATGSPLAAGAIAFAAGWLVSSLIPASEKERTLAGKAVAAATSGGGEQSDAGGSQVKEQLTDVVANLREPAMEAARSVGATAADAAKNTADAAKGSASSGLQAGVENARNTGQG